MQSMDDFYETTGIGKDQFNDVLIDQISVEGETMAVPFDNHGWLLWVNEKAIEDAGLDPAVLPANGAEFIDWAQQITTDVNGNIPTKMALTLTMSLSMPPIGHGRATPCPPSFGNSVVASSAKTSPLLR
jgi:ABC-type glycerol-3-phosphate transport system substrate-binding protein